MSLFTYPAKVYTVGRDTDYQFDIEGGKLVAMMVLRLNEHVQAHVNTGREKAH